MSQALDRLSLALATGKSRRSAVAALLVGLAALHPVASKAMQLEEECLFIASGRCYAVPVQVQ